MKWGLQRGTVMVTMLLFIPVLVIGLGGLIDVGTLVVMRYSLQTAADLASLAGVQEIDLDLLAAGERVLDAAAASASAETWADKNLVRLSPALRPGSSPLVTVHVYNASAVAPLVHIRTGRTLVDPTVSVAVSAEIRLPVGLLGRWTTVSVRSDASVVGPEVPDNGI